MTTYQTQRIELNLPSIVKGKPSIAAEIIKVIQENRVLFELIAEHPKLIEKYNEKIRALRAHDNNEVNRGYR